MAEITQAFFDRLTEYGYTGAQGLYASRNWVRARMTDPAFDKWRDNLWIARFSDDLDYAAPTICGSAPSAPRARTTVSRVRRWIWILS